jgi:hypothetical protein
MLRATSKLFANNRVVHTIAFFARQTALIQAFPTGNDRHIRSLSGFYAGIPDAYKSNVRFNHEE